ncbi:hypothetical protein [Ciceribacter sp. L1K22]|uniref:hypothetical protein n=1 Tax=Ciceribacter sp. L1K22 TaxID=2820275 RepID=UPI001ABE27F4|nr:hypothetical protein [Ciceribacter sp. L1K22]MBO3760357.1 hypothetical protein [Ciceribacter sp. L1K22]
MSDPTNRVPPTDIVHVEHYCEHPGCKRWGGFGFDLGRSRTAWFCGEHRDDGERGRRG